MMNVLYINACVREESRTNLLAQKVLEKYGNYKEIKLNDETIEPLRKESLTNRTELINKRDYSANIFEYAKEFAEANIIVISAPYWDLSFPALLKIYLENIYITGLVSRYGDDGKPEGLCKGKLLYYVSTAGGPFDARYSYDYVRDIAIHYFGIKDTKLIVAEMLDIEGYDADKIINETIKQIENIY